MDKRRIATFIEMIERSQKSAREIKELKDDEVMWIPKTKVVDAYKKRCYK